jgi:hypothetical protein
VYKDYAYRSVTVTIANLSETSLRLVEPAAPFPWGQWLDEKFPEQIRTIASTQRVEFVVESERAMTGCEGTLDFVSSDGRLFEIHWDNPGTNHYTQTVNQKKTGPVGNDDANDDDRASVLYSFMDDHLVPREPYVPPPLPGTTGGTSEGEDECHISIPCGSCKLPAPGWRVYHKIERDDDGFDRFRGQTCDLVPGLSVIFVPKSKPPENRVAVFFFADAPYGHLLTHAARAMADLHGWILVGLDCNERSMGWIENPQTVEAKDICDSLGRHGYDARIDKLRMACHSRASNAMLHTMQMGVLAAYHPANHTASECVVERSAVDRIVSFDSDDGGQLHSRLKKLKVDMSIVFGSHASIPYESKPPTGKEAWTLPRERTVQLSGAYDNDIKEFSTAFSGLIRLRYIDEALTLHPEVPIPPVVALYGAIEPFPPLGSLSSHNIREFCAQNKAALVDAAHSSELLALVDGNDGLTGYPPLTSVFQHHLFVAEFFHEVTSPEAPLVGKW